MTMRLGPAFVFAVAVVAAPAARAVPGSGDVNLTFTGIDVFTRGGTDNIVLIAGEIAWTAESLPLGLGLRSLVSTPLFSSTDSSEAMLLVGGHVDVVRQPEWGIRLRTAAGPELHWSGDAALVVQPAVDATLGPYVTLPMNGGNILLGLGFGYAWANDLWREHTTVSLGVSW